MCVEREYDAVVVKMSQQDRRGLQRVTMNAPTARRSPEVAHQEEMAYIYPDRASDSKWKKDKCKDSSISSRRNLV